MYIGPWQEYRLAKIQDDAVQRIRQEWEDNIRAQLPEGDDTRIRELMQPLMAKLPALLMAKKPTQRSDTAATTPGSRRARRPPGSAYSSQSTRPSTAMSTTSSMRSCVDRSEPGKSRSGQSNQETHDNASQSNTSQERKAIPRRVGTKKAKKKACPTSALEDVERRRKMFATWMKSHQSSAAPTDEVPPTAAQIEDGSTRLPPIHPSTSSQLHEADIHHDGSEAEITRLPPIYRPSLHLSTEPEATSPLDEPNLDDSVDEDEVNQLLNWTDNLLSPNALEASLDGLGGDLDDVG